MRVVYAECMNKKWHFSKMLMWLPQSSVTMTSTAEKLEQASLHDIFSYILNLGKTDDLIDFYYRQRVKEQIARDRAERAAKFSNKAPTQQTTTPAAAAPPATAAAAPKKDYDSTRLQVCTISI